MRLEELNSLNEDEVAMLWFIFNKTTPPVLNGFEIEPSLFCFVKQNSIINRVNQTEQYVKDEYKHIHTSLKQKLNMIAP